METNKTTEFKELHKEVKGLLRKLRVSHPEEDLITAFDAIIEFADRLKSIILGDKKYG